MVPVAAEHPDGRHDRDEAAVAGLVEYPADLLDLLADLDCKAARRFLRRQYLGALVNLELRMVEEDVEAIEEGAANLVAVLGAPAHPAHQPVHAFRSDAPRRRFRRQAACDLAPEEHFGSVESEIGTGIDDLLADRRGGVPGCTAGEYARSILEYAVENTAIEGDHLVRLDAADAQLGKLLFDLAAKIAVHGRARFDREKGPEIPHRNAVERGKAIPAFIEIGMRPARRCLDQRIGPGLEINIGIERRRDQRVGEADELHDAVLGKLDVEQAEQRLVDMREHIGGRGQLPSIAPAIIDAEKGFLFLDPGDERQEIRIAVACDRAVQDGEGKPAACSGSGRLHGCGSARAGTTGSASSVPGTSRICSSTGTRAAVETGGTR